MKKALLVLSSLALASAPVLAETTRAVAPIETGESLGGDNESSGMAALLAAIGVAIIVIFAISDDDDEAVSP